MYYVLEKDPQANKPFALDLTPELGNTTLASATWSVVYPENNADLSLTNQQVDSTGKMAKLWIGGGVHRNYYKLKCAFTTAAGWNDERTVTLLTKHK